jgi:hypothetical protein
MEQQLAYLLDRSQEFGIDKVKILDELTVMMSSNSIHVKRSVSRQERLIKCGID